MRYLRSLEIVESGLSRLMKSRKANREKPRLIRDDNKGHIIEKFGSRDAKCDLTSH